MGRLHRSPVRAVQWTRGLVSDPSTERLTDDTLAHVPQQSGVTQAHPSAGACRNVVRQHDLWNERRQPAVHSMRTMYPDDTRPVSHAAARQRG